ncbi:MAG: bifunctional folylpolyglutamate synthase/dihydrofolate synthase [Acidimicrobiia bacterium]|nr:bifunctional folylpolyglutamate synthase/dihydrofolate synthase [Acidimicrobiia bacterium]
MSGDLPDLLAWLDGHWNMEALSAGGPRRAPSLDRIRALLDASGDPQRSYPVLHITGTNGKTSTARILSSLLVASGLAVGTTTSPHLERINERITGPPVGPRRRERARRQHDPIPDEELADQLRVLKGLEGLLAADLGPAPHPDALRPTWFELVTACAFRWFADVAVDAVVAEVGMGGRSDATNVADGQVAVLTTVGLDHVEYLGPTVAHIADEKAGIVKAGATVIVGERDPVVVDVFEKRAAEIGAERVLLLERDVACEGNELAVGGRMLDIRTPRAEHHEAFLPLHGRHQGHNAALAVAAAEAFFDAPLSEDVLAEGLARVTSPGRLEVVGRTPLLLLDGAHNVQGMEALARALDEEFPDARPLVVVIGVLAGHDPVQLLDALGPGRIRLLVACPAPSPRTMAPDEVARAARSRGLEALEAPSVAEAVEAARADAGPDGSVLVTGSLYVAGPVRAALREMEVST